MGYGNKSINDWVADVTETAKSKGWHEEPLHIPEALALIHSEVSEALEAYREAKSDAELTKIHPASKGKPEGFAAELADVVIRCFHLAGRMEMDLEQAIREKNAYNETRPVRHGGKRC